MIVILRHASTGKNAMKILVLFALLASASLAQDTRVILLGTGTPNPEPDHSGPAVAVVSGKSVFIVDAGPGVVRRAVQAGIQMDQLTRVFITHLHSDHTIGLPDLIFTPAVTGRREPLEIYGPPGLRAMIRHIMQAWSEDMRVRLHGLEPAVSQAYIVHTHEIKPGEIYRQGDVRVSAFPVSHGSWKHAFGYRFDAAGKVIVISGDTTFSENLIAEAKGCDILVHEFYSRKVWEERRRCGSATTPRTTLCAGSGKVGGPRSAEKAGSVSRAPDGAAAGGSAPGNPPVL